MRDKKSATNPFYSVMHPFDCSYDIRFKGKGSVGISIVILVICFLASIFQRQNTGYIFNSNKLSELNIFKQFISVALPFGMLVIANWVVSILMNGTGKFRDIWIYTAYCCVPYIICNVLAVLLSNVLVAAEPFAGYVSTFGSAWSLVVLFIGLMVIHEYGFVKNVFSCFCTLFVMFLLVFLIMLLGSLTSDLYGFVVTIAKEILYRVS